MSEQAIETVTEKVTEKVTETAITVTSATAHARSGRR